MPLPRVDFVAEPDQCSSCSNSLRIQKSKTRVVATLAHGVFEAREIRKVCELGCCGPVGSTALRELVPPGQRHGYDLVVHVGLSRYLAARQREEIRQDLFEEHGIELSTGTISRLCERFLALFEALHLDRAPQLRAVLQEGYPLHIDATCERGKGGLFITMAGWRGWVLQAGRVPSENADHLAPLVGSTVELFGVPLAVLRDMGEGVAGAAKPLREAGVLDLICHRHFAAAVGKALMEKLHDGVRGMIRLGRIRSDMRAALRDLRRYSALEATKGRFGRGRVRDDLKALVLWVLEGDGRKDAPFPFALPHLDFFRRCRQAQERADQWVPCPRTQPERRALRHLASLVGRFERDRRFAPTVQQLEDRWRVFSELRDVLRLSDQELPGGDIQYQQRQLPALELLRLRQIKQAVDEYRAELEACVPARDRNKRRPSSAAAIILKYFDRYGAQLFGHPARFDTNGQVIAVVERTNNRAEHFFGREKRLLRRRLGRAQLGRDLEQQPAQVALVSNLRHSDYVRVVCGSLDHLPAALAALDMRAGIDTSSIAREHRDKQLLQRVRELLKDSRASSPPPADEPEKRPAPEFEPLDLTSEWSEFEGVTEGDLRAKCRAVFRPS
ncbi:MAG: IS66 family transposase [Planctomycetota bacterium]|jgi:hypothetical protein